MADSPAAPALVDADDALVAAASAWVLAASRSVTSLTRISLMRSSIPVSAVVKRRPGRAVRTSAGIEVMAVPPPTVNLRVSVKRPVPLQSTDGLPT